MELNVSLSLTPLNSVWQHKKNRREKYFYRRYIKVARVFLLIGKNKYKKKKLKREERDDNTNIHRHITHTHTHTSLNKLFGGYFFFFLFKKRKVARWCAYILVRTNERTLWWQSIWCWRAWRSVTTPNHTRKGVTKKQSNQRLRRRQITT
jgi:hypothetical protein